VGRKEEPVLPAVLRVIFWTYERGGWQYDILSALILAFIFLTPRTVFDGSAFSKEEDQPIMEQKDQTMTEPALQILSENS
jgi:hypothetical protein